MKAILTTMVASFIGGVTFGADSSPGESYLNHPPPKDPPIVTLTPFEPPRDHCYKWEDKYAHPEEVISPQFLYPFEMRRAGIDGEVGILVEIDEWGYPKRLSILYATFDEFSRYAVKALEKARWRTEQNRYGRMGVWFYYKAVYSLRSQPNLLDPASPSVTPPARAGGAPSAAADH